MRIAVLALAAGCHSTAAEQPDAMPLPTCATHAIASVASVTALQAADFDGDGHDEIVITGKQSALLHVDGTLVSLPIPKLPDRMLIGDVNGDGHLDLVAFLKPSAVQVLLGDGAGGFTAGPTPEIFNGSDLAIGDVDGDGIADLIAMDGGSLVTFLGPALTRGTPLFAENAQWLAAGDLDGDHHADVVYGTYGDDCFFQQDCTVIPSLMRIRLGRVDGFANAVPVAFGNQLNFADARIVDLDGDGHDDLVGLGGFSFTRWANRGDGSLAIALEAEGGSFIAVADLDGDGTREIASTFGGLAVVHGLTPGQQLYATSADEVTAGHFSSAGPQLAIADATSGTIQLVEPGCPH